MKNTELTIGTKVSYTKTSVLSEPVDLQSVVKGFFDGYVCLENGDKMSRGALTIIGDNNIKVEVAEVKEYYYRKNRKSAKMYKAYEAILKVYNVSDTKFKFQTLQDEQGNYFNVQLNGERRTKMFIKALELGAPLDKLFMFKDSIKDLAYYAKGS